MFIIANPAVQKKVTKNASNQKVNPYQVGVNVHKTSFRILPQKIIIPQMPVSAIEPKQRDEVAQLAYMYIPDYIKDCLLLEKTSIGMTPHVVEWVRPLTSSKKPLLYVFRLIANYMGGAETEEHISQGGSSFFGAFETDRFYFEAHIIHAEKLSNQEYRPIPLMDSQSYEKEVEHGERAIGYGIFSEIDYTEQNAALSKKIDPDSVYHFHRAFPIFQFFHLSPAFHIASPSYDFIDKITQPVEKALECYYTHNDFSQLDSDSFRAIQEYVHQLKWNQSFTRSGLRCWLLDQD